MFVGFLLVGAVIQYGPIRSIKRLARQADAIAEGDLSVDIEDEDRIDEVGQLRESFRNTQEYIETITRQSEKLSRQEFDAEVLDEEIPGRVGESMARMQSDLERFIDEIERERDCVTVGTGTIL
jgi:methyl-accepting chemotaxis protein